MSELSVGLHAGSNTGVERAVRKWQPLIDEIHLLGATAVLINEGASQEPGQVFGSGTDLNTSKPLLGVRVDSIRDFTSRLKFADTEPIPTLNMQSIVNLAGNKANFYPMFPEYTAYTIVLRPEDATQIEQALHAIPGEFAVVKPARGRGGVGVVQGAKAELIGAVSSILELPETVIIQERLDTSQMSLVIKPANEEEVRKLQAADGSRELRLFCSNSELYPVLRATSSREQESYYVYVDPETVPESAFNLGRFVINKLLVTTNETEIFCAIDLFYDAAQGTWVIGEVNAKEPGMPTYSHNLQAARSISANLSRQLVRMAKKRVAKS